MKNIYCISGLGADERVFRNLKIPGAKLVYLPWAQYDKHDEMSCYAQKMAYQIKEENPIVLGVSFGGMLATEMKILNPHQKTIIISSAKTNKELPHLSGILRFIIKTNIIPYGRIAKSPNKYSFRMFGAENEEEKELFADILRSTDLGFIKWATKTMLDWRNDITPDGIFHIHGTADRLINPAQVHPTRWVDGGSHFMIYNRAAEVSRLIAQYI